MSKSGHKYQYCLYFSSNALARKMEKLAAESWKKVNLSPSLAYLLMAVLEEPGIQPTALAELLQLQASTITRLVEKLEKNKLLIRVTEGKMTNIYPTPKARQLQPQLLSCMQEFMNAYGQIISPEESLHLTGEMNRINQKIKE